MYSLAAARNGMARSRSDVLAQQPWYTISALAHVAASSSTNVHNATECFILTSCVESRSRQEVGELPLWASCSHKRRERLVYAARHDTTELRSAYVQPCSRFIGPTWRAFACYSLVALLMLQRA
jgi:hypothetical protein